MTSGVGARGLPADVDLFDVAEEMPFVTFETLPMVARALAAAGWVVLVGQEGRSERPTFRGVARRIRCLEERGEGQREDGADVGGVGRPVVDRAGAGRRPVYQDEASERRTRGAVPLASGGRLTATLSVPVEPGIPLAYVQMSRRVPGESGEESADFVIPAAEMDAALVLLEGVVAQARRDGVLPPVSGGAASPEGES
jgi:hypothetical protein